MVLSRYRVSPRHERYFSDVRILFREENPGEDVAGRHFDCSRLALQLHFASMVWLQTAPLQHRQLKNRMRENRIVC